MTALYIIRQLCKGRLQFSEMKLVIAVGAVMDTLSLDMYSSVTAIPAPFIYLHENTVTKGLPVNAESGENLSLF